MRWKTLEHNGVLFPPPYEPKGLKIRIRGRPVELDALEEEMVYHWAKKKDTPYAADGTFQKNFTDDLASALGPEFKGLLYSEIDFTDAYLFVDRERDARDMMSKEERKALAAERKRIREEMRARHGSAVVDGQSVDVANYMAEPPGIFIGRGDHPLRGKWKRRVTPVDVVLNLGRGAAVPPGSWKGIVHERSSIWLASWTDELTKKRKYVWLADTAAIKQVREKNKYNKAIRLSREIERIKDRMVGDMRGSSGRKANVATACYLICRTAMRVGDEKDPDEADTVGATTLRREHIRISDHAIKFDFLGKDSVRWEETVPVTGYDVQLRDNLKRLVANKKPGEEIFHGITSRHVNAYLSSIMKGLSAKVFRTYLASTAAAQYLRKHARIKQQPAYKKLYHAKLANLESAVTCNHKRTIPKTFERTLQKRRETLKRLGLERPWAKAQATLAKAEDSEPRTEKQKERRTRRIARLKRTIQQRRKRHRERVEKIKLQIALAERTRDYNLGTSLRNYIDPRIFKSWTEEVGMEWEKMYTAALQKKFLWVKGEKGSWRSVSSKY